MRKRPWRWVVLILALLFLIGVAVAVLFNALSTSDDDLASIIARAGVAIAATTVAGALATAAFKFVDEQRGRDQERRRVFSEIVKAYNEVKSVRRSVKALGLLTSRSEPSLRAEESKELRATMAKLNDAQLKFEAIVREIEESDLFKQKALITEKLRAVEDYINKCILDRWESGGGVVWEGASPSVRESLGLRNFDMDFKEKVRTPLDELTKALHQELFGYTARIVDSGRSHPVSSGIAR